MIKDDNKLLTYNDVAKLLAVSKRTIQRLKKQKKLPFCIVGSQVRFSATDIQTYIDLNRSCGEF